MIKAELRYIDIIQRHNKVNGMQMYGLDSQNKRKLNLLLSLVLFK